MKNTHQKGFATLAALALIAAAGIAGYFGSKAERATNTNLAGTFQTPEVRALFETSLASKITDTATSFTLSSATDKDGTTLASSTYGFIIDEGTANEELVLADCTSTACTNATRGLSVRTGTTTVSALRFEHRRGASVKITDAPSLIFATNVLKGKQNIENPLSYNSVFSLTEASTTSKQIPYASWVFNNFVNVYGTQTVAGDKTFSGAITFSSATTTHSFGARTAAAYDCQAGANSLTLCSKSYIDAQVVAGGTDGSETVKGIFELSTAAEAALGTSSGGTSARLVLPGSLASSTRQVATTIIPVTNSSGYLDNSFLNGQNYVFGNATTTNATTTAHYTSGTASSTDLRTNTATVGTLTVGSCTGCGGASNALTIVPHSPLYTGTTTNYVGGVGSTPTKMSVGQVIVPFPIIVNGIMVKTDIVNAAGTVDITMYSESGATQLFSVTSAALSAGTSTIAVSAVTLNPGIYYVGVNENATADIEMTFQGLTMADNSNTFSAWDTGSGTKPRIQGTLTITSGTPPATITPSAIVSGNTTNTLMFRLDN